MMNCRDDNLYFSKITGEQLLVQNVRSVVLSQIHQFFSSQGFVLVDPPILHEQISGKKHEIYLPLYGDRYSLNSSNALYMGAYAALLGKVYAVSPTFRDEQDSVNHLVEFRMLEVEALDMLYMDLPDLVENLIIYLLKELINSPSVQKSAALSRRVNALLHSFHPRKVSYTDFVYEINHLSDFHLDTSVDLSNIDYEVSKFIYEPVFIMDYPRKLASWTAKPQSRTQAFALNLILPGTYGELCEGCERTNDIDLLQYKMNCAGIENLQWYLDAVKQISVPRCGFGIGVDRLVRWITGLPHIQGSVLFPRVKQE